MSRTVTSLFDSRPEAEEAKTRLISSRIDTGRVRIIDQSSAGSGTMQAKPGQQGFMAALKDLFMPDEDRHAYAEGISRGGYLVCAEVDEHQADEAIRILEQSNSVDFDQRQDEWRQSGWQGFAGATSGLATPAAAPAPAATLSARAESSARTVQEEHIPIVEEELRVGKREVARGGARVRSYIKEIPVHEQVNLREEHVSVERRPVNQPIARGELDHNPELLRERTVEVTETAEEAVVGKEARVTEEVVIKKTAEERVEQIDDTVRRTEVDVDGGASAGGDQRSAFSSFGGERTASDSHTNGQRSNLHEDGVTGSGYAPEIDKSGL